ncbi:TIM barrel protein [Chitinophagaceae bacterium LB-8]|uniref:TIM barrel protein n=1 Tax=Paraflavisolibacter caeni TaxID=2982496 RepID=A0A9X2XXZ7_9BACT|nr:TIM barrel protein [Paraflavisolibacter caeni]MCU7549753.1 TIM barrel protein [Paraflavisolibacter caeni]
MATTKYSFNLNYAPHFGMFENLAGKDLFDQLRFMADTGFRSFEDSGRVGENFPRAFGIGMVGQPPELLDKIGETLANLGMEMGTFLLPPTFWPPKATLASGNVEWRALFLEQCHKVVETAKRLNGRYVTVVADTFDYSLPLDIQTANVIEGLRYACDIFEPHGITMVLEPLSDHPSLFLRTSTQAYLLCKAVNRKCCKILFDMYHLQKNEGRLIYHMDQCWDEIGYFQVGDEPGRNEPMTGEINYKNIFKHIAEKSKATNKEFILGMEHHNSLSGEEGEMTVINTYRWCDDFNEKEIAITSEKLLS